jgi:hypothetical protein
LVGTGRGRAGEVTGIGANGRSGSWHGRGHGRGRDVLSDVCGVGADEAEQRRSPGVCQGRPRKYRRGTGLTPRWWTGLPALSMAPVTSSQE